MDNFKEHFYKKQILKTNKQMAIEHMGEIAKMMRAKTDQPETVQFWLKHYAEMIESEIRRYET